MSQSVEIVVENFLVKLGERHFRRMHNLIPYRVEERKLERINVQVGLHPAQPVIRSLLAVCFFVPYQETVRPVGLLNSGQLSIHVGCADLFLHLTTVEKALRTGADDEPDVDNGQWIGEGEAVDVDDSRFQVRIAVWDVRDV